MIAQNSTPEPEGTTRATVELPDSLWEAAKIFATKNRLSFKDLTAAAFRSYLESRGADAS